MALYQPAARSDSDDVYSACFNRYFFRLTGKVYLGPMVTCLIFIMMLLTGNVCYIPLKYGNMIVVLMIFNRTFFPRECFHNKLTHSAKLFVSALDS